MRFEQTPCSSKVTSSLMDYARISLEYNGKSIMEDGFEMIEEPYHPYYFNGEWFIFSLTEGSMSNKWKKSIVIHKLVSDALVHYHTVDLNADIFSSLYITDVYIPRFAYETVQAEKTTFNSMWFDNLEEQDDNLTAKTNSELNDPEECMFLYTANKLLEPLKNIRYADYMLFKLTSLSPRDSYNDLYALKFNDFDKKDFEVVLVHKNIEGDDLRKIIQHMEFDLHNSFQRFMVNAIYVPENISKEEYLEGTK